jgi:hypothetical protein
LTGTPADAAGPPAERGWQGYGLWRRYWSALLGVRLPPLRDAPPPGARADPPANPVTAPSVLGPRIRLPRFDRAAARFAATGEREPLVAGWTAAGWQFTVRESGPGEVELLARRDGRALPGRLLPVDVDTETGSRRYFMVFMPEPGGGSTGVLRFTPTSAWIDVTIEAEMPAGALNGADPTTRAEVARSVAATPDPAMPAWAAIVAARPDDDPVSQVIRDAAR